MSRRYTETAICPRCGKKSEYTAWSSLNGTLDPEAKQKLLDGTLFIVECPSCGQRIQVYYPILYHDMEHAAMVYFVDESCVEDTKAMFAETKKMVDPTLPKIRNRIVTDQNALREKAIIFENELDDRVIELLKQAYLALASEKYPDAHVTAVYFYAEGGKREMQLMAEEPMFADFKQEVYNNTQKRFAALLKNDDEPCINSDWARRVLKS